MLATILLVLGTFFTFKDAEPFAATYLPTATAEVGASELTLPDLLAAPDESSDPQYLTVPIRDLQVMHHRVMAHNPLREEVTKSLGEFDPFEWRVVRLQYDNPDGGRVFIERGMMVEEIEFEDFAVGDVIPVSLPENGIEGDFVVTDILPCPTPAEGDGQLVTTKFIHENAEVYDLKVEGSPETIGTTAGHRFWSEDRQDFVAISEFHVGEQLELADGTLTRLESLRPRSHLETVYNIEIDGEHVYHVGGDGILVHNECAGRHHFMPRYLGSKVRYGHGMLKKLSAAEHTHLHSSMRTWMKKHYPDLTHGPGKGRSHMVNTYTLKSRVGAVREFYRQYRNPSGKNFLRMFEEELKKTFKLGLIE